MTRFNRVTQHHLVTLAGVGCFLLLAVTNGSPSDAAPHWLQFVLLYLGIILLIGGLGRITPASAGTFSWGDLSRHEWFQLTGVLALAAILRFWELGSKVRVPVDEVLPMTEILALWGNPHLPMISPLGFISSQTRLFASWQAASVAVWGHNLLALRIPSAVVGTLTVGAVYFLGRVLFDRRTALIGALILAAFPPHLQFSRIGILNIADPLFGTLAFAFICLAFKNNRRIAWVLGGVALGLTQYFYEGGRLLYPALILMWVMLTLLANRKAIRSWIPGFLTYCAAAVVIAAPIYYTLARSYDPLSNRFNTLALTGNDWLTLLTSPPGSPTFDFLIRHLIDPFLLFISRPDPTPYYGGSTALLLFFLVPPFLAGCLWAVRSRGGRGLLLWFFVTWAGNILMVDSALAARYVTVFPAVALLIAIGITQLVLYLPDSYRFKITLIVVGFCVIGQTIYYFGPHLDQYEQQLVPGRDGYAALFRAAELPSGTTVYLIDPPATFTEDYAQTLLRFLAEDKTIHLIEASATVDFSALQDASTYAFFIPSDDPDSLQMLSQHFDLDAPIYTSDPLPKEKTYTLYLGRLKS